MKYIKPYLIIENEEPNTRYFPFTEMLIAELDRLGIEWKDVATPRQRKNGTAVLEFSTSDAIRMFIEGGIIERETRPRVKTRLLNIRKKYLEGQTIDKESTDNIVKMIALFKKHESSFGEEYKKTPWASPFYRFENEVNTLLRQAPKLKLELENMGIATNEISKNPQFYTTPRPFKVWVYRKYLVDSYGDGPSDQVAVRWEPDDLASMEQAIIDFVNREIGPILSGINNNRVSTEEITAAFIRGVLLGYSKLSTRDIDEVFDIVDFNKYVIKSLSTIEHRRSYTIEEVINFYKNADLSNQKILELLKDPTTPEQISVALRNNPNYDTMEDLFGSEEW